MSSALRLSSDAVAQSLAADRAGWDAPRTLWIAVWGGAMNGLGLQTLVLGLGVQHAPEQADEDPERVKRARAAYST